MKLNGNGLEEMTLKLNRATHLTRRIFCLKCGQRFDLFYSVEHYSTRWLNESDQ